ncbi:hypothetical protein SCLCIDRAFT_394700 [Scleroderma citrinum Foug A]|uniref:Uncharacterized protein n=1 Tax=Scleroderma citrinum Foug A TaxID=1036808 RepID=A0A0C3AM10_9AGAM|nr:hypothetical protein SCLCIDRAFT_394700 [Scleroderma citrinum Foug A]
MISYPSTLPASNVSPLAPHRWNANTEWGQRLRENPENNNVIMVLRSSPFKPACVYGTGCRYASKTSRSRKMYVTSGDMRSPPESNHKLGEKYCESPLPAEEY